MNGDILGNMSLLLIELGSVIVVLALFARLANKLGISPIPLYLLAGLAFGDGGLLPLHLSEGFVHIGAEIGIILLLFSLGLEYTSERLGKDLHTALPAGVADFVINFTPGVLAGILFGWSLLAALLLGGIVYISSSGIISKLLTDLKRLGNQETPTIMSILVLEDVVMMVFLPLMTIFLVGQGFLSGVLSIVLAGSIGFAMFFVAMHYGRPLSRLVAHQSNEVLLLTTLGFTILVAGVAEWFQLSAAVGAFMVGLTMCKPVAKRAHALMNPLKDLFAALFFLFFGLSINSTALGPVIVPALALASVTGLSKMITAWWTTRGQGLEAASRLRAGVTLMARGEFSLVIAAMGISAGLEPQLGAMATAYVLITAIAGPLLLRVAEPAFARVAGMPFLAKQDEAQPEWAPEPTTYGDPQSLKTEAWPARHSKNS